MKACPNIEELHIGRMSKGFLNYFPVSPIPIDHFSDFKFRRLTRLSINGIHLYNGSYLPPVMN